MWHAGRHGLVVCNMFDSRNPSPPLSFVNWLAPHFKNYFWWLPCTEAGRGWGQGKRSSESGRSLHPRPQGCTGRRAAAGQGQASVLLCTAPFKVSWGPSGYWGTSVEDHLYKYSSKPSCHACNVLAFLTVGFVLWLGGDHFAADAL